MNPAPGAIAYGTRLSAEQEVYRDCVDVHDLPGIFHYWTNRHVRPALEPFGFSGPVDMFRKYLFEQCLARAGEAKRFVSIGAGNCDLEVALASRLRDAGCGGFVIECLDMNPAMLERGRAAASKDGVGDRVRFVQADFNDWKPEHEYDAVIANQSLHHVVELEYLFAAVKNSLKPHGVFLVSDMIGRNGHQRWPEALEIVHEFWRRLPPSYRFNRQLQRYEEFFADWDCSVEGFEGIRSQDILPLLVKEFHFQLFIGFGNVIDPFVDRTFGYNFDPAGAWDRDFIDRVHARDREEMASGRIAPTHVLAVMGNDPAVPMIFQEPLTPEFCLRKASPIAVASPDPRGPYEWNTWPHEAQSELKTACRRLSEAEARIKELPALLMQHVRDLEEQTAWALGLNHELEEKTALTIQLERELEERTAWALRLKQELEEQSALALERTHWALGLDRELEEKNALALELKMEASSRETQLSGELEQLSWARALDRRFHRPLHAGFQMIRAGRDLIRRVRRAPTEQRAS